jgi:hypothetical protein
MSRIFPHRILGKTERDLDMLVCEYMKRSLTFQSDIHNAFRGILAAHEREFSATTRILAGLRIQIATTSMTPFDGLVPGLLWGVCNLYPRPSTPSMKEMQRRPGFPSWTWLGWKTLDPANSFSGPAHLQPPRATKVSMEYDDGLVLPWADSRDVILARDSVGSSSRFIHIRGPTLDIQVAANGQMSNKDGTISEYHATWCQVVAYTRRAYPVSEPHDSAIPFTLLALTRHEIHATVVVCLLYQPAAALFFERVQMFYPLGSGSSSYLFLVTENIDQFIERDVRIG